MSSTTAQKFKITVPITKCYLRKTADGIEKYVIEGMASNTNLDLTGERMAETAIKSMASSLESHPVIFKNEHGDEWDAEFGEVTALYATDSHQLMMEAELDPDHYRTKTLVKALEKGKSLGLSIGGLVPEGGAVSEWVSDLGRKIKTYKDILLEEISVTGSPAVADTWLLNITKSVKDWKETPMEDEVTKHEIPVEEVTTDETVETAEDEVVPATEDESTPAAAEETEEVSEAPADEVTPEAPVEEAVEQEATDPVSPETPESEAAPEQAEIAEAEETQKSLTEAKDQVEQLTKSLSDSTAQVEELTKSLVEKDEAIAAVQEALDEAENEVATLKNRRAIVFDKFDGHGEIKETPEEIAKAARQQFAGFITGGIR